MATTPENANKVLKRKDYQKPTLKTIKVKTADGEEIIGGIKEPNTDALSMYNKTKNMKQVNKFGEAFPMLRKDQAPHLNPMAAAETPEIVNRAAGPQGRNMLVADQSNPQPPQKIAASSYQRDQMFGDMASSQGQMYNQQASTTPQVQTFPPQQGLASYASPTKIDNTNANAIIKGGKDIQEKLNEVVETNAKKGEENKDLAKRVIAGVATGGTSEIARGLSMYDGPEFNAGLKNAMKGKEGKFADMVADAPGMHEKHTQISKANVNSARRDDKAHIDYLKRDINYDSRHGGSDKSMTDDEKHISKLAGDIKYDTKKKKKYDNV